MTEPYLYCVSCDSSGRAEGSSNLRVTGLCRTRPFSFDTSSLSVAEVNTAYEKITLNSLILEFLLKSAWFVRYFVWPYFRQIDQVEFAKTLSFLLEFVRFCTNFLSFSEKSYQF